MRSRKPVTVKNAKIAKESMNSGEKSGGASDCRVDVALEFMRLARIRDDQNHAREMVYVYADRCNSGGDTLQKNYPLIKDHDEITVWVLRS